MKSHSSDSILSLDVSLDRVHYHSKKFKECRVLSDCNNLFVRLKGSYWYQVFDVYISSRKKLVNIYRHDDNINERRFKFDDRKGKNVASACYLFLTYTL